MSQSSLLFEQAKRCLPGGVNSPVRAFNGVGGTPLFFKRAEGAFLIDEDDQRYIDYVCSWGPMLLGHSNPAVKQAVKDMLEQCIGFGASTKIEIDMATEVQRLMPSLERIRMVNSGTEATMSAIRLARGYTGRDKIIKFSGCYHGHSDCLLVQAGSGALTLGIPNSLGVPESMTRHTLSAEFNNLDSVRELINAYPKEIAGIIVEPVAGNMGCVPPERGFLDGLRKLCDQQGIVLIFDEVMTGFRVALGGAQQLYGVTPDLTTLGKIIGGGLPVGAFGGKRIIMDCLAPLGGVYQAGTLSGNPITMAAGLATLRELSAHPKQYQTLAKQTEKLALGIKNLTQHHGIPATVNYVCGMFSVYFNTHPVTHYQHVLQSNVQTYREFFHALLKKGVYFPPSAYEACFLSLEHDDTLIDETLHAVDAALMDTHRLSKCE